VALEILNMEFNDGQVYPSNELSNMNQSIFDLNIRNLKPQNEKNFLSFKDVSQFGNYAPLIVEYDKIRGFCLKSVEEIPENTLICEIAGEIESFRNKIFEADLF